MGRIYPKGLNLNQENQNDDKATFLDMEEQIIDTYIQIKTYDEIDAFKFEIISRWGWVGSKGTCNPGMDDAYSLSTFVPVWHSSEAALCNSEFWKYTDLKIQKQKQLVTTQLRFTGRNLHKTGFSEFQKPKLKKLPKSNLIQEEKQRLNLLKNDKNPVIKPADKGSAIVLLNHTDYTNEATHQLSGTRFYIKTHMDLTRPAFYFLHKICKKKTMRWPIISSNNSPTEKISTFVDEQIKQFLPHYWYLHFGNSWSHFSSWNLKIWYSWRTLLTNQHKYGVLEW